MSNSGAFPGGVGVLGAGSWGTALAILISRNGTRTMLWGRNQEKLSRLQHERRNSFFLPNNPFPENLSADSDLAQVLDRSDEILIVVPSHGFRQMLQQIKQLKPQLKRISWATKGLEPKTQKLLHQLVIEEFGDTIEYAVVSGPTFATEVADSLPTAVTIASNQQSYANDLAKLMHSPTFLPYLSDDVIGLEIGGAVKNVLAIAAGIADGLGFGSNTRAALITRGIAEMMRLALAVGAKKDTLMGLSGMGDLLLTCTDNQSRNRRMGLAIGAGKSISQAQEEIGQVVEGLQTAREIVQLATSYQVKMPIVEQVYQVIYNDTTPKQAVKILLERDYSLESI